MTLLGIGLGLLSAAVFGVAAVVQASAVRGFDSTPDGLRAFVTRSVGDLRTMAVVAAYLVGFVLHAAAIWLLPLYLAQAMVAMSLPVTAIASRRVEDDLGRRGWVSVVVVTVGLVMLSLGAGTPGDVVTGWAFVGVLWACVAVLAVVSLRAAPPARPGAGPGRRSRVRRVGDRRARGRHAGHGRDRDRRARRTDGERGGVLALLARHEPGRRARRRPAR